MRRSNYALSIPAGYGGSLPPKLRTPPQFRDLKSGEDVEAAKSQAGFARMDTVALWTKLEQIYLPISNHFSDPYQYRG